MIEKVKSITLTVLVLLSLFQSYLLAYSFPKFELDNPEEYVRTDPLGSQGMLEDMLFPDQLVLHLGNDRHTVLYPNTPGYTAIVDSVKQRTFESFRRTNLFMLDLNWEEIRTNNQGVEVRFRDGLPMSVLQRVMQVKGELPSDNDLITRIWIFAKDDNEVRTILFTDTANMVYEVLKADFTTKDMERFVQAGGTPEEIIPYTLQEEDYYLPAVPVTFNSYEFAYTQYTVDQLKRTFFVDPAVIRQLTERDGTEIYTDGKRGLQLRKDQRWLVYSDPVAEPVESQIDLNDNLASAVHFINQHGGWNDTYAVQKLPQQRLLPSTQAFIFRQYYDSLPVMNLGADNVGFMKIVLQKGTVSSYERSTIIPDRRDVTSSPIELAGGEALQTKLQGYEQKDMIYSVFPAYRSVETGTSIRLIPVWTVELRDGTYELLK